MTSTILIVALGNSVHTQRWLEMVRGGPWSIVLLSSIRVPNLPEIDALPAARSAADVQSLPPGSLARYDLGADEIEPDPLPAPVGLTDRALIVRSAEIARAVRSLRPQLIHTMEIQFAGYAALRAAQMLGNTRPPWLVSNWGSDLYLYAKLGYHRDALTSIAQTADGFTCECRRDIALVRAMGFGGGPVRVIPASGGQDFENLPRPRCVPSKRRRIVVKGYHGWSGRANHILSALYLAAPALRAYAIDIVLADASVAEGARLLAENTGLDIVVHPWSVDHQAALERIAAARIVIGIGISDGIGTTLLESMALGAFPIAANTSCATEWITSGLHGFIVDPHDVERLAEVIRLALQDDELVDRAAPRNRTEVERRWDPITNRKAAFDAYHALAGRAR